MRRLLCEIFEDFQAAPTRVEKVAVLKANRDNQGLKAVLRGAFHPKIEYRITSVPYYKPSILPRGMTGNSIGAEIRMCYLFEKNNPKRSPQLKDSKMNQILIQILESLEADEATIFINMLLKDLRIPGLDREVVLEAFPGLLN